MDGTAEEETFTASTSDLAMVEMDNGLIAAKGSSSDHKMQDHLALFSGRRSSMQDLITQIKEKEREKT